MTILPAWKTLQDLVDQFEQVVVKEKGKLLEAWIWSQIQSFLLVWGKSKLVCRKSKLVCRKTGEDTYFNETT